MEFFDTTFGKPTIFIYVSSPLLESWIVKKLRHCYEFIKGSEDFDILSPWLSYLMIVDDKKVSARDRKFLIEQREQLKANNNWLILINGKTCDLHKTEKVLLAKSPTEISKFLLKLHCQSYPLSPAILKDPAI